MNALLDSADLATTRSHLTCFSPDDNDMNTITNKSQLRAAADAIRAQLPLAVRHVCDDHTGQVRVAYAVKVSPSGCFVRIYDQDDYAIGLAEHYACARTGLPLLEVQS